jgi:hypothetical protein
VRGSEHEDHSEDHQLESEQALEGITIKRGKETEDQARRGLRES